MSLRDRLGGLQFEIVSNLFVVMLAGLAIVAVVMGSLAARTVERAALEQLRADSRHLERLAVVGALRLSDLAALARTTVQGSSGASWTVLDSAGREIGNAPWSRSARAEIEPLVQAARAGGEAVQGGGLIVSDLILVVPLQGAGREVGLLVGIVPREVLLGKLLPLLRSGAWVLVMAAAFFVVFGAYLLRRRIVAPLQTLSAATRRLAEGDLEARTSIAGSDEIADLARSFNHMAASLARERDALVRAHESLAHSQRLATVGQLAAGVAHEVGNPLAAILGYAEVVLRDGGLSQRSRDAAERLRCEALRVRSLVRELLDFARSDRSEVAEHAPVALLERLAQRVRPQKLLEGIELEVHADAELPPVWTDARRVEQVLVNLVENAAHALAGQPDARIELSAAAAPGRLRPARRRDDPPGSALATTRRAEAVELCVVDNGPGIDPETLPSVFDPFFTTKDPGDGTGLGLWNAHRLAELLGGRLEVESSPGHTRFALLLPVLRTEAGAEADRGGDPSPP